MAKHGLTKKELDRAKTLYLALHNTVQAHMAQQGGQESNDVVCLAIEYLLATAYTHAKVGEEQACARLIDAMQRYQHNIKISNAQNN